MNEKRNLEYKEEVNNTFVKTVSAYANYGAGEIVFGIKDNGEVVGIKSPDNACLDIENKINDLIKPKPSFSFSINRKTNVITLFIDEGPFKPYLYKGKAYKRSDTSTVEVDQVELRRLTLLGENLYFDELSTDIDNLSFNCLFSALKKVLNVEGADIDILKTLGLYNNQNKYNNAALLLSDKNNFSGIDIVRVGSTISEILFRETISNVSIIEQLDKAEAIFDNFYRTEEIVGMQRRENYLVPKEAFRETIANALIHRTWDTNSHIRILMQPDKIEVFSPGGLPIGLTKDEYLNGYVSNLRNPIIANVFFRLNVVEMFGTGIRRIKQSYVSIKHKPVFEVTENSIVTILPSKNMKDDLSLNEKRIVDLLSSGIHLASSEIADKTGFSKNKVVRLVNALVEKRYIKKEGTGRGTKYLLI